MSEGRKYRKPPVVEALCELYFSESTWDDTAPGKFYDQVKDRFPRKQQQEVQEAQILLSHGGGAAAGVQRLPPRMQFHSDEDHRLIQLSRDLLVVNQLEPYPRFEDWEPTIYWALDIYRGVAQPKGVARIGLRYINRVVIPKAPMRMEDYFTIYPKLPEAMGEAHGAFMIRVELPGRTGNHDVLVTFGSAPASHPKETAHLLDLYDILQPESMIPIEHVKSAVSAAHANLETAFEGSITDPLRTLFEPEGSP